MWRWFSRRHHVSDEWLAEHHRRAGREGWQSAPRWWLPTEQAERKRIAIRQRFRMLRSKERAG